MPTNKNLYLVLVSLTCCREWISLACSARFLNCTLAWFILCRSFMGLSWMFRSKKHGSIMQLFNITDIAMISVLTSVVICILIKLCWGFALKFYFEQNMLWFQWNTFCCHETSWKILGASFSIGSLLTKVVGGGNLQREETCSYCIHRQWIINNTISLAQTSKRILKKYEVTLIRKI